MRVTMKSGWFTLPLLVTATLLAQQPRFGATVEVRIIEVEAVVTDRDGNAVHGLTAADFEIFEGRARQPITNFAEYRAAAAPLPAPTPSPTGEPVPAGVVLAPEPRTILLVIDTLPLKGPRRDRVFDSLREFVNGSVRADDRIGIVSWETYLNQGRTVLEPVADREAALRVLDRIAGSRTFLPTDRTAEEQAAFVAQIGDAGTDSEEVLEAGRSFRAEEHLARMRRKTAAMRRLLVNIGGLPGRKVVLYVSQDFALPHRTGAFRSSADDTRPSIARMLEEVGREANAQRVTIYAIRPEEPDPFPSADVSDSPGIPDLAVGDQISGLLMLTEATGGLLERGVAAMERIGPRLASELDSYYSLGYRSQSDGSDRTRNIRVRVRNPAYSVRARESFVEKSDETFAREQLVTRLFAEEGAGELRFGIEQGTPRATRGRRWILPVKLTIPVGQLRFEEEKGKRVAHLKVFVVGGSGIGDVSAIREQSLPIVQPAGANADGAVTYSFELLTDDKGSRVSIAIFDERTGLAGFGGLDLRGGKPGT